MGRRWGKASNGLIQADGGGAYVLRLLVVNPRYQQVYLSYRRWRVGGGSLGLVGRGGRTLKFLWCICIRWWRKLSLVIPVAVVGRLGRALSLGMNKSGIPGFQRN